MRYIFFPTIEIKLTASNREEAHKIAQFIIKEFIDEGKLPKTTGKVVDYEIEEDPDFARTPNA